MPRAHGFREQNRRLRTAASKKAHSQPDIKMWPMKPCAFDVLAGKYTTALWDRPPAGYPHLRSSAVRMPTRLARVIVFALLNAGFSVRSPFRSCRMERTLLDKRIEQGMIW